MPQPCEIGLNEAGLPPLNGNEPNAPALTLPEILSPSTLPANSKVSGMGEVMFADQDSLLPSTLPLTGWVLPCAFCVPLKLAPSLLRSSCAFWAPIGELIVISHFPSMAMADLLLSAASKRGHPRGASGPIRRPKPGFPGGIC